jgi:hypothetical protein
VKTVPTKSQSKQEITEQPKETKVKKTIKKLLKK